jgi:SAM-dependent methyltransferase
MDRVDAPLFSRRSTLIGGAAALAAASASLGAMGILKVSSSVPKQAANPEWLYVPTPMNVVERMLELAAVTKDDLVLDLGSGDGRIPIVAAQKFGARGRGVDIDPVRIAEANSNLKNSGVGNLVSFVEGDVFKVPVADASVVTMFLFPHVVLKLRDRLRNELKPGTRIVSHKFMFHNWEPERTEVLGDSSIFLWRV